MCDNCSLEPMIAGSYVSCKGKVKQHEEHGDVLSHNESVSEHDVGNKRIPK